MVAQQPIRRAADENDGPKMEQQLIAKRDPACSAASRAKDHGHEAVEADFEKSCR